MNKQLTDRIQRLESFGGTREPPPGVQRAFDAVGWEHQDECARDLAAGPWYAAWLCDHPMPRGVCAPFDQWADAWRAEHPARTAPPAPTHTVNVMDEMMGRAQ